MRCARCAARLLDRPFWFPFPSIALRALGEVSQIFLEGRHVVPDRLLREGWAWRFPNLAPALSDILAGHAISQE